MMDKETDMRMIMMTVALATLSSTAGFAADAAAGKAVYDKSCKSCHGAEGTPPAGMAKAMNIKDFKSTEFSDADIKTAITDGKGKMKPVSSVTGASVDNVVAYVRSLKK
jgi:mono/diheme cytochrome c family protein